MIRIKWKHLHMFKIYFVQQLMAFIFIKGKHYIVKYLYHKTNIILLYSISRNVSQEDGHRRRTSISPYP